MSKLTPINPEDRRQLDAFRRGRVETPETSTKKRSPISPTKPRGWKASR